MQRREFITFLGGATAWPLAARAQQNEIRRLGVLIPFAQSDPETDLRKSALVGSLKEMGWSEGRNLEIIYRYAGGDGSKILSYAAELASLRPDVILANSTPVVAALRDQTQSVPIVFNGVSDPIGSGFAKSMARPGGNITGFTNFEPTLGQKLLELVKEIAPSVSRVAVLFDPAVAPYNELYLEPIVTAARSLGVEIVPSRIHNDSEIASALDAFARKLDCGLIVLPDVTTVFYREKFIALAAQYRLPAAYPISFFGKSGGLVAYGVDIVDSFRRSAVYIDKILRGAKPADLPLQAPTKFELVINLKTAKALGLTVPPTLLTRADEVIE